MGEKKDRYQQPSVTLPTERERPRPTPPPATSETLQLQTGFTLGKYRIVRPVGAGGMGAVYEAVHAEIGKPVALKVLSGKLAVDPRAQMRFLQEAAAVSRLQHPHVVNVTDYGAEGGVPYIAMELLKGEDLAVYLDGHLHGLSGEDAVDILLAVCAGVFAAHEAGIVHRDLKPRNIFLARTALREREPKVLDFGISKVEDAHLSASLTDTGAVMGTTHYMSPEQLSGKNVDNRTDQYSLGVVLYECLTGRRPHEGDTVYVVMRNIAEGKFVPPSILRPDLPRALEAVVLRAMAPDPAGRFATVHALGEALLPFASPRKRIFWSDYYYGRDPLEVSARGREGPAPLAPLALPPTVRLPEASPKPPLVSNVVAAVGSRPSMPQADSQRSEVATTDTAEPSPARRSWWRWALLACGAGVCGIVVVVLAVRPAGPTADETSTGPVPLPIRQDPPRGAPPPEPSPALPPEDVIIEITDAPPGLTGVIDGKEVRLPVRLPKRPEGRVILFRAPGYESKQVSVDTSRDRTLALQMRERRPETATDREVTREPKKRKSRRAPPVRAGRSDSPAPFVEP